jgi:uncharacterized protein YndB with AHSA1/START domain
MAGLAPWDEPAVRTKAVDAVVHVSRTFPAPREEVYAAWTEAKILSQWFRPGDGSSSAELDVRPGGSYRITLQPAPGQPGSLQIVGRYLEVEPPERLVFTFGWETPDELEDLGALGELDDLGTRLERLNNVDSRVIVRFRELEGSTEVSIVHERLATQNLRAFHIYGWEGVLEKLDQVL